MGITARDVTADDAPGLAALMARIEVDHPTGFCLSETEVLEIMNDLPGSVVEGAWDGDEMVGYAVVLPDRPQQDGQRFVLYGDVDPGRLGEGIGTLMLGRALDRARALHAADAPHVPARYASQALAGRTDQADLLVAAGMSPGRHGFLMRAGLDTVPPRPPLPDDLVVTPFEPGHAEELRTAHNAAFADYPDFGGADPDHWQAFMLGAAHVRHDLSLVARDRAGSVVSYVFVHEYAVPPSGEPGREAYVPYVGTLPAHRGRGVATGLLARVLAGCRAAGYDRASLNVDTANPTGALGIYERAGFETVYRQDFYRLVEPPA